MNKFIQLERSLTGLHPEMELRQQEPMAKHTSFRVGGPVKLMAFPHTEQQLIDTVSTAKSLDVPVLVLGNGSNLLVADRGVDALAISTSGLSHLEQTGALELTVGAGVSLSRIATFACEHGLTGLEFAHGIPGTLGGAVTMNAGAYGGEMVQVVSSTRYLSSDGAVRQIEGEAHQFGYRHSVFSGGDCVVLSSVLTLQTGDPAAIRDKMAEFSAQRKGKQPLEYPSGGSTFKRPEGYFAAALIDQCGLKGFTVGGAQVSEKHAGFVINRGGATCGDILELVEQVKVRVLAQTGVTLELEIKIIQ